MVGTSHGSKQNTRAETNLLDLLTQEDLLNHNPEGWVEVVATVGWHVDNDLWFTSLLLTSEMHGCNGSQFHSNTT